MKLEINIWLVLAVLIIHWLADFIFQDEKWAVTKSKSNRSLLKHTTTYTLVWAFFIVPIWLINTIGEGVKLFDGNTNIIYFLPITFVIHTITDYYTSRLNAKLYIKGKFGGSIPNWGFYSSIGLDQVYHYVQLFLTIQILLN